MSGDKELDARELDLEWVLERVVDGEVGTILSCIPGKLGLYAAEDEFTPAQPITGWALVGSSSKRAHIRSQNSIPRRS